LAWNWTRMVHSSFWKSPVLPLCIRGWKGMLWLPIVSIIINPCHRHSSCCSTTACLY